MKTINYTESVVRKVRIEFSILNQVWYASDGSLSQDTILKHLQIEAVKKQFGNEWELVAADIQGSYLSLYSSIQDRSMFVRQKMDSKTGEIKLVKV